MYCWLIDPAVDTPEKRQSLFNTHSALGQTPALTVYNRTWSQAFHFPATNQSNSTVMSWELTIPTTEFSHQDKTPTEQWRVSVSMDQGEFLTQGSLLHLQREPILHWLLGDRLPAPPVLWEGGTEQLVITKSPCSPDVAVLGVAENNTSTGVVLAVTYHRFEDNYTTWFNLTQNPSLCNITSGCSSLQLVDMILTNRHLLLLTNQGLFVSSDLIGWDSLAQIQFLSTPINSLMSAEFQAGNVSRATTRLWSTPECESVTPGHTPADHLIITHQPPVGSETNSSSYYSTAPYMTWQTLSPLGTSDSGTVLAAAYDLQKDYFVILKQTQEGPRVTVMSRTGGGQLYPPAELPPSFTPSGLAFHPVNHFLYAYGSQVFVSLDGGSSFSRILSLRTGQTVVSFAADVHDGAVAMVTNDGAMFYGTAGIPRMSEVLQAEVPGTAVLVDNTGQWYQVRENSSTGVHVEVVDITSGIQSADTSFARPLVPQFLSADTIVFHEHQQLQRPWETAGDGLTSGFSQLHVGQKLQLSTSGSALITQVTTEHRMDNYTAWARAHVFRPFQFERLSESPAQAYSVEVACESNGKSLLTLQNVGGSTGWLFSDVGKSLVVATGNNHLLTDLVSTTTARADPVMTCKGLTLPAGLWQLYDFSSYREHATVYNQALTISSTTATVTSGYFEFAPYHVGLVLQVSSGSATVTAVSSVTQVTLQVHTGSLDGSYPAGEWSLQEVSGQQAVRKWNITEDECRHVMNVQDDLLTHSLRYMDVREDVRLAANATIAQNAPEVPSERALLVVSFGNPFVFQKIETDAFWDTSGYHHLTLHVVDDLFKQGHSSVTLYIPRASLLCPLTSHTVTLRCQCPPNKHLRFVYQNRFTDDEFLYGHPVDKDGRDLLQNLEVNYRPPSSMGVGIPLSNNIYNADPSQDRPNDFYQVSQDTGQFKQCYGKSTREECGCTEQMKLSSREEFSDCIDRAHRMLYPAVLPVQLQLVRPGTKTVELDQPYVVVIEEVNSRSDYVPDSVVTPSLARLRDDSRLNHTLMFYSPRKLSVLMTGARLFHFRVSVLEGFSYCNLNAEFMVYVDRPPIAYPSEYIMRGGISIMIGMILFLVYLYYLHTHHTPFTIKSTSQHSHLKRDRRATMADSDSDED